jgi:hypothetical protein
MDLSLNTTKRELVKGKRDERKERKDSSCLDARLTKLEERYYTERVKKTRSLLLLLTLLHFIIALAHILIQIKQPSVFYFFVLSFLLMLPFIALKAYIQFNLFLILLHIRIFLSLLPIMLLLFAVQVTHINIT